MALTKYSSSVGIVNLRQVPVLSLQYLSQHVALNDTLNSSSARNKDPMEISIGNIPTSGEEVSMLTLTSVIVMFRVLVFM
jgi:hypothetical protein